MVRDARCCCIGRAVHPYWRRRQRAQISRQSARGPRRERVQLGPPYDKPKVLEQPFDLALEIPPQLDKQSAAAEKSPDGMAIEILDAYRAPASGRCIVRCIRCSLAAGCSHNAQFSKHPLVSARVLKLRHAAQSSRGRGQARAAVVDGISDFVHLAGFYILVSVWTQRELVALHLSLVPLRSELSHG